MMCSEASFLLLVTFCGTVQCIWSPYRTVESPSYPHPRPCDGVHCPYIYCTGGQYTPPGKCCPQCEKGPNNDIHLPCKNDDDCRYVVCENPGEEVECHVSFSNPKRRECHCHVPGECDADGDCIADCGQGARCDDGACHGNNCDHT
ncbi:multiple epidermal growth factor-like domains protein 10 [Dreissena polymorpha]|uniref:Uncharacterized protein n=1 Tax=Dreissena polymorpha TaxID=45954 RepID=A0A9D4EW93_DREPO|nr:multiple epidermal growth factor-like domains protein 10 [Dreissena polymorpha]KAH3785087.1 hypothetical protein DPMN_163171 [Dreissena polymorpha]